MGVIEELQSRRVPLATLPTPLESARTLPSGRRLLIKRDDLTGLGIGGNKARKAEMLCAEAVTAGADALVTVGAAQSNHARVTAAAGARLGLETHLVRGGSSAGPRQGNQLLAELFGATLHDGATDSWTELARRMDDLVAELRSAGRRPYAVPLGGSTAVGASAFVLAWCELLEQLDCEHHDVAAVVIASSTGGTHAGMLAGRALFGGPPVVAIDVAKASDDLAGDTRQLADETLALLGSAEHVNPADVLVDPRFVGPAYAVPTPEAHAALVGLARCGGWVLDRVYSAKGFAGLPAREAEESFGDGDVVFWHTGGQPALFAAGGAPPLGFASDVLSSRSLSLDMERP